MVDDLIAYRFGDDDVFLIPNAANTAEVVRRLVAPAPNGISVVDQHERRRAGRAGPPLDGAARRRSACPPTTTT